jgi:hypothetical protein
LIYDDNTNYYDQGLQQQGAHQGKNFPYIVTSATHLVDNNGPNVSFKSEARF